MLVPEWKEDIYDTISLRRDDRPADQETLKTCFRPTKN